MIVFKESASGSPCVGIQEEIRAFVDAAIKANILARRGLLFLIYVYMYSRYKGQEIVIFQN
jgi:hypothetical protein